jgi:hypothetical protein
MYLQITQKSASQPLVNQNASVLRIIGEFHHIIAAVIALYEVRLRPTAHLSDQITGSQRHMERGNEKIRLD